MRDMPLRLLPRPAAAVLGWAVVAAACTQAPDLPPPLRDCVPIGDAGCTVATGSGAAGGTPGGDQEAGLADGGEDGVGGCGTADTLLAITNTTCEPCIQGSCCQADMACGTACQALIMCVNGCNSDATCIMNCPNMTPTGVQAYEDFAACVNGMCMSPECPTLQSLVQTDF